MNSFWSAIYDTMKLTHVSIASGKLQIDFPSVLNSFWKIHAVVFSNKKVLKCHIGKRKRREEVVSFIAWADFDGRE
jgi:hypothetical protein